MKKPPSDLSLTEAIAIVRTSLAAANARSGRYFDDPGAWHARHQAAMDELATSLGETIGARITSDWKGARVRILGISSTSTSGTQGALRNWLVAAEKREQLAQEASRS